MNHVGPGRMREPEPHGADLRVKVQGLGPSILTRDLKSEVERKLDQLSFWWTCRALVTRYHARRILVPRAACSS